jgi:hypothetical protein
MSRTTTAAFCLSLALATAAPPLRAADHIGYHDVKTDAAGRLVPWYGDQPLQAYDHVVRQVWNFWITMRNCPDGVPYYLQHQVWKPDKDDPRGLGGDQLNMALSSWNLLYGYLGDPAVRANMRLIADFWMAHGLAPSGLLWGDLPYPYNLDANSPTYDGDMRAGPGVLQPDKAASFGAELVMMYKATGERRYLDCAVRIADRLVKTVKPGDADNSPWPFRVNATTTFSTTPPTPPTGRVRCGCSTSWRRCTRASRTPTSTRPASSPPGSRPTRSRPTAGARSSRT